MLRSLRWYNSSTVAALVRARLIGTRTRLVRNIKPVVAQLPLTRPLQIRRCSGDNISSGAVSITPVLAKGSPDKKRYSEDSIGRLLTPDRVRQRAVCFGKGNTRGLSRNNNATRLNLVNDALVTRKHARKTCIQKDRRHDSGEHATAEADEKRNRCPKP